MRVGIAAAITGLLLAACITDGPRDSGGTIMQLSESREIEWVRARTNVPLFLDTPDVSISRIERDNGVISIDEYRLSGRRILRTEHVVPSWFSVTTEQDHENRERFEEFSRFVGLAPKDTRELRKITRHLAGFYADNGNCWAVGVAVRLKPQTIFDNDLGNADTTLWGRSCEPLARPLTEIIERLDINDSDQRAAIRTHRAALMAGE